MDIESLRTFLEVARAKSFTRAAETLYCTQAAISMRIKRLEDDLGCKLFVRYSHTIELTSDGKLLLPYARQIDNAWAISREYLMQSRTEPRKVEIACPGSLGTYLVPSLIYLFRQQHPYVLVYSNLNYTKDVISAVGDGLVPLGIVPGSAIDLVASDKFLCEPLVDDLFVLVVYPSHPWAGREGVYLQELTNETLLLPRTGTQLAAALEQLGEFRLDPEKVCYVSNIESVKHRVYNKLGVSVMSEYAVRPELELGTLHSVPILDHVCLSRQICTLRRRGDRINKLIQLFLDFVREAGESGQISRR